MAIEETDREQPAPAKNNQLPVATVKDNFPLLTTTRSSQVFPAGEIPKQKGAIGAGGVIAILLVVMIVVVIALYGIKSE